ncbi:MAG TPA: hypothetical protein VFR24_11455, partial [Candidatus Angelobacter sp.]|nr:hypothetical protein [Candidatus Angelobacter sp.]
MTRQEVITAIKRCAEKLGRVPTIFDLVTHEGLARPEIRKHFGSYKLALEECRLEVPRWGQQVEIEQVFNDWMGVARALKRCPTLYEYEGRGKYRRRQVRRFFGEYKQVPERMRRYAEKYGLESEWEEVMELLRQASRGQLGFATAAIATHGKSSEANGLVYDPANGLVYHPNDSILGSHLDSPRTPVYGPLIHAPGFVYGP